MWKDELISGGEGCEIAEKGEVDASQFVAGSFDKIES